MGLRIRLALVMTGVALTVSRDLCYAQTPADHKQAVAHILGLIYHEEYDSALVLSRHLSTLLPDDPAGYVLQLSAMQAQMRTYRARFLEGEFESLTKLALKSAERNALKNPDAEMLFMIGTVHGLHALHRAHQGAWAVALREGLIVLHTMNRALAKDPTFMDPAMLVAMFEFWKSKKLDFGLGLYRKSREQALALLERVWHEARYISVDAAFSLQDILLHDGEYAKTLVVSDWLQNRFPRHPTVLYHRALLFEKLKRQEEALVLWQELIEKLWAFPNSSSGYLAECYLHCAQIHENALVLFDSEERRQAMCVALRAAALHAKQRDAAIELESGYQSFKDIVKDIERLANKHRVVLLN